MQPTKKSAPWVAVCGSGKQAGYLRLSYHLLSGLTEYNCLHINTDESGKRLDKERSKAPFFWKHCLKRKQRVQFLNNEAPLKSAKPVKPNIAHANHNQTHLNSK